LQQQLTAVRDSLRARNDALRCALALARRGGTALDEGGLLQWQ
jgi:hypothetical protein